jgi:predicted RNA-binding protein with PUA-like domain
MMARWLFKSEPEVFGWDQQVALGAAGGEWSGVRNAEARNNMRAMRLGDLGFFYHSQEGRAIVGIVEVAAAAHPDSTAGGDPRWVCVDVRALRPLARPVTLAEMRADPALAGMVLLRRPRLSVQPVTEAEWRRICALGGVEP